MGLVVPAAESPSIYCMPPLQMGVAMLSVSALYILDWALTMRMFRIEWTTGHFFILIVEGTRHAGLLSDPFAMLGFLALGPDFVKTFAQGTRQDSEL